MRRGFQYALLIAALSLNAIALFGTLVLASAPDPHGVDLADATRSRVETTRGPAPMDRAPFQILMLVPPALSPLKVENARLLPAPLELSPSSILKFDILNQGLTKLTDIALRISIVAKPEPSHAVESSDVLAGPLLAGPITVHGTNVLDPGYTIKFELILRNLRPDCSCVPVVEVASARSLPD